MVRCLTCGQFEYEITTAGDIVCMGCGRQASSDTRVTQITRAYGVNTENFGKLNDWRKVFAK